MSVNQILQLPQEQEAAETLRDELVDLKEVRAYQLATAGIEDLLQVAQGHLEREPDVLLLKGYQGQVLAYRKALGMVDEIITKLKQTDYEKVRATGGHRS